MRYTLIHFAALLSALTVGCAESTEMGEGTGGSAGMGATAGMGAAAGTGGTAGSASNTFAPSPDCSASPPAYVEYSTQAELEALLVKRWRRCIEPQIPGEELGVEFTPDGKIFPLYTDADGNVQRRTGVDFERSWTYLPSGSPSSSSGELPDYGQIRLSGVTTNAPWFTDDPVQLRILFTPVLARYTPLE